jgi:DNA processing protein
VPEQQSRNVEAKSDEITSEANDLLSAMGFDTISFESLLKISGLTSEALSSMLMVLELDSKVTTLAA